LIPGAQLLNAAQPRRMHHGEYAAAQICDFVLEITPPLRRITRRASPWPLALCALLTTGGNIGQVVAGGNSAQTEKTAIHRNRND
jgi:hypothetical protein